MPTILHVNASPRAAYSDSLHLANHFIEAVQRAGAEHYDVETLDLFDEGALPPFGRAAAAAKMAVFTGQEKTAEQLAAWDSARTVFEQFAAADAYVFNIPLWNSGVPYVVKQWIDIITQPGWSFSFDPEQGYSGLIEGKQAVVIHTSGIYSPGVPPAFGADFSTPFFADWLSFVGVHDATHVRFAPTSHGDIEAKRTAAEVELSDGALTFAGKLNTAAAFELVNE